MSDQVSHGSKQDTAHRSGVCKRRVHLTRVDSEGCITFPDEWMSDLGWQVGDELAFAVAGTGVVVTKLDCASPPEEG